MDRASSTLSTGERQRTQLARAVRTRTTGVLYVLDKSSIGLHPANIEGLIGVLDDLVADGNSVVLVDHDTQVLSHSDWLIELGPQAGAGGGKIIAQGSVSDIIKNQSSMIGKFLPVNSIVLVCDTVAADQLFAMGEIRIKISQLHTVKPLTVSFSKGRLSVITGVSGSGKTTMVLESLVPALKANIVDGKLPNHVRSIKVNGIQQVQLIDATPIGSNVRSTVATYANIHDELRKVYAKSTDAKERGYKAGDFSYNTGKLRCPTCDGTGTISLDVQFLPDVDIPCPDCKRSRYSKQAYAVKSINKAGSGCSLPELMAISVDEALGVCDDLKLVQGRLKVLHDMGLGYLTLGEETPSLSSGEAQRLKLASEMGKKQSDSVFVFDEPTIGLHPLDVKTLLMVFQHLIDLGATVIVIEHDLDVIRNADYIVDMGPDGRKQGGQIIATGTPNEIKQNKRSFTGRYL